MTIAKLEDMGLLCMLGRDYAPTHAFNLMTVNRMKHAKIQCALFKGVERDIFIDRREYKGPIYEQIEEAYQLVKRHINLSAEIEGIVRRDVYELPMRAVREANSCKEYGLREPVIEELGDGFRVVFYRKTAYIEQNADNGIKSNTEIWTATAFV